MIHLFTKGVVTTKSHCVVRRANALEGYLRSAKSGDVSRDIMIIHVRDVQIFQKGTNTRFFLFFSCFFLKRKNRISPL